MLFLHHNVKSRRGACSSTILRVRFALALLILLLLSHLRPYSLFHSVKHRVVRDQCSPSCAFSVNVHPVVCFRGVRVSAHNHGSVSACCAFVVWCAGTHSVGSVCAVALPFESHPSLRGQAAEGQCGAMVFRVVAQHWPVAVTVQVSLLVRWALSPSRSLSDYVNG